jgi:hypothetical protein
MHACNGHGQEEGRSGGGARAEEGDCGAGDSVTVIDGLAGSEVWYDPAMVLLTCTPDCSDVVRCHIPGCRQDWPLPQHLEVPAGLLHAVSEGCGVPWVWAGVYHVCL